MCVYFIWLFIDSFSLYIYIYINIDIYMYIYIYIPIATDKHLEHHLEKIWKSSQRGCSKYGFQKE